jgi:hypothetical protein
MFALSSANTVGMPLLAVLLGGNTSFRFFEFLLMIGTGPFKVKSTTSPVFLVQCATYPSSSPDWLMWRKCTSFLLQLSLDNQHWALKSQVNNVSCTFDAMCDLPFF